MKIHMAKEEDLPNILTIYNHAVLTSTSTFDLNPQSLEERYAWFNKLNGKYPLYVIKNDDKCVGFGAIGPFREKEAYKPTGELSVYIDDSYKGQGLATKMIKHLLEVAPSFQIKTVISVITTENLASIHIHKKLGFQNSGTLHKVGYKFNRWLDVVFFEMQL